MKTSQTFFHQLIMLYRPFENKLNALLTQHQLQRAQWSILYYLYHFGAATLVEISAYQGVEKPTVTRTMNRLWELGWVEQIPSTDKREKRMQLTPAGREFYLKIRAVVDQFEEQILRGISEEQQQQAIRMMQTIRDHIIEQDEGKGFPE